jgi:hypothetical protein
LNISKKFKFDLILVHIFLLLGTLVFKVRQFLVMFYFFFKTFERRF